MGMFDKMGDMMGMMGKLQEAKQKVEEVKTQLALQTRDFSSEDEQVKLTLSVSGEIKDMELNFRSSSEEFTDVLINTLNKAYKSTKDEYEQKLAEVAKEGMPNIPGLT